MTHHSVIIIGAGPIGLELAVALKREGIDYLQLDAGQIGSTMQWYPQQMLFHSSAERLAISGVAIQTADQQKPTREEFLAYLRAVVLQFDLRVRTYERVVDARQDEHGGFTLTTNAVDGQHTYHCEALVLAIGAMHMPKLLGVPGEDLPHVSHYFHDPHTYFDKQLLIIGGRNSAVEAAVRCQRAGARVTLSYRKNDFDAASVKFWLLPEIRSMIRDKRVRFLPGTTPREIRGGSVVLDPIGEVPADFVLMLTGYKQDTSLFAMLGVDLQSADNKPRLDDATMETNVRNVFVAGTAIAGSPAERVRIIVEDCHVHVPRIVETIASRLRQ
ncbi:MAG: NAD(P)-binding domain-containing protein [Acidobacteria bacterium]|nr:NAD(P)-binding domain-containing protein [Acidobacteriota bacterium]MBV9478539.1 NAD(P)-binding domain-containing protein [Acidobacteriota bacterium]